MMNKYFQSVDDGLLMQPYGKWTEIKLDYLARYIEIFETAMRNKWEDRNYIDLFAGCGKIKIKKSGRILLGSPLIALHTLHPFTGYHFVDKSKRYSELLEKRCAASPVYKLVNIYTGDCNLVVAKILKDIKPNDNKSLNLAFLDPYGFELHWDTVVKLASMKRMDLIIYYPQMGFTRYIHKASLEEGQTAVDLFFGGRDWREIYKGIEGKRGLQRAMIDFYKSKLRKLGYSEVFQGSEELGNEPLISDRNRNISLYRLLFASKHDLGHKFWKEVVRRDAYGQRRLF